METSGRYRVDRLTETVFGEDACVLRDQTCGSSATIIPGLGCNLMSFIAAPGAGRLVEVILGAPEGETRRRASAWGNPILFPFPNRVRRAAFTFRDRPFFLPANVPEGHLHGLVRDLPWRLAEEAATGEGATLRCTISTDDHPDLLGHFPFPFRLSVTYTLSGNTLRCEAEAVNTGTEAMPMGFGLHPYFRLPFGPRGSRAECVIRAPAGRMWELDADKLPTGRRSEPPPDLDFRGPRRLGGLYLDHSYSDLSRGNGEAVCYVLDPVAGVRAEVRFGPEFPHLVVFAPEDRDTVSFEPYTCVTDAVNLAAHLDDTGLIVLEPGHTWRGKVDIVVDAGQTA